MAAAKAQGKGVLALLLVDLALLLHCDLAAVQAKPATVTAPAYKELQGATNLLDVTLVQAKDLGRRRAQFEHALATLVGRSASSFTLARHPLKAHP